MPAKKSEKWRIYYNDDRTHDVISNKRSITLVNPGDLLSPSQ